MWPVRLAALECCRTGQEKGIPGALGRVHGGVKGTQRQAPGKMGSQTTWDHHGLQPFFHRKGRQEKACSGRKPFSPGPINMNCKRKLARVKASTSPHLLCVKNQERSGGVPESFSSRKAWLPKDDLSSAASRPLRPPLPRRASTLMRARLRQGCGGGGRFGAVMKELYFYGLMRKKGVCVLPDFGSAGGHTGDYSKRRVLGKRERKVTSCVFPSPPTFLPDLTFAAE